MSSAASGFNFLPNLLVPRAPQGNADVSDLLQWGKGVARALEQFRVILESQTEAFISSSAYIADATITTAHIQDLAVTTGKINDLAVQTAKIGDLQVTTLKRQDTNVVGPTTRTVGAGNGEHFSATTGLNGNMVKYDVWEQGSDLAWAGPSNFFGVGYNDYDADTWKIFLHNGQTTAHIFNYYIEWW